MKTNTWTKFRREVLYPACTIFFLIVFMAYLILIAADVNVLETETVRTEIYDGQSNSSSLDSTVKAPKALPVQTLFGIFVFALIVMTLSLIKNLKISKAYQLMIHYIGTIFAFFVFVLGLSGYVGDNGFGPSLVACLVVSIIYFVVLGINILCKKIRKNKPATKFGKVVSTYVPSIFAAFTLIVFAVSFFALITQFNVIVKVKEDKVFIEDDVLRNIFVTVVTPLAPTFQNYMRYLASGAVYILGYAILKTNLKPVVKIIINFLIITAGFLGIWIFGFDYFRLVKANALPAVIIYLSTYIVILTAVCVYKYFKKRKTEQTEDYEKQF